MRPSTRSPSQSSHRLSNIFEYYQPTVQASLGHTDVDAGSSRDFDRHTARLSEDAILTALAQLAAFKVAADRCFVSLIDDRHQIVIAEATRTISLSDSLHDPDGGGLSVGSRSLDFHAGVGATTLPAFVDDYDGPAFLDTLNIYADHERYVIRDFRQEEAYSQRPYVTGWPHMRFFAEVPVKSLQGFVIGTLAVVDNAPRQSLDAEHFRALTEVAAAVARHLAMIKTDSDQLRTANMVLGLDTYVQLDRAVDSDKADGVSNASSQRLSQLSRPATPASDRDRPPAPLVGSRSSATSLQTDQTLLDPSVVRGARLGQHGLEDAPASTPAADESSDGSTALRHEAENARHVRDTLVSSRVQARFAAASRVLCDAMQLDGVVFLDVTRAVLRSADGTDSPRSALSRSSSAADTTPSKARQILTDVVSSCASDPLSAATATLPEATLRQLLHLYPSGCIFDLTQGLGEVATVREFAGHPARTEAHSDAQDVHKVAILTTLSCAYPGVQSAVFLPLWSHSRQAWVAASVGWTNTYHRILQQVDASYWSVVCNCILTDVCKMDLEAQDRAKSDFISSISHEIRSPLHGILGNAELLRDVSRDARLLEHIDAISSCGHSLLDIIDHILDYAKIKTASTDRYSSDGTISRACHNSAVADDVFELDALVEETLQATVASHRFQETTARKSCSSSSYGDLVGSLSSAGSLPALDDVAVLLKVPARADWQVRSSAVTWKRILLNIVGNSLKHTSNGLIEISLDLEPSFGSDPSSNPTWTALLSVRDTGRGMSKDFLQNHLFAPFAQEDVLSVGTGLGLSIVQRIVHNLGGNINVWSERHTGTRVDVSLPVEIICQPERLRRQPEPAGTISFLGFDDLPGKQTQIAGSEDPVSVATPTAQRLVATKSVIEMYAKQRCGLRKLPASDGDAASADILVVDEGQLNLFRGGAEVHLPKNSSILVVSASGRAVSALSNVDRTLEILAMPLCPMLVVAAIQRLLEQKSPGPVAQQDSLEEIPNSQRPRRTSRSQRRTSHGENDADGIMLRLAQPALSSSSRGETASSSSSPGSKLLLVDDNHINVSMLAKQAAKLGCPYETAVNGKEALRCVMDTLTPFALIFMDLSMPVIDGFEATRAIRTFEQQTGRAATPIVALSGLSSAESQHGALVSGADLFLTKPISMKRIKGLLTDGLGGAAAAG